VMIMLFVFCFVDVYTQIGAIDELAGEELQELLERRLHRSKPCCAGPELSLDQSPLNQRTSICSGCLSGQHMGFQQPASRIWLLLYWTVGTAAVQNH